MKICLVGYGKMGKAIESIAINRGHTISHTVDPFNGQLKDIKELIGKDFDVVIDFSSPNSAIENMKFYAENNFKVVMGTTGRYDKLDQVKSFFQDSKGALLRASNFSLGVNIYREMLKKASQIIDKIPDYDIFGHEFHHNMKIDSPSGTALTTAKVILDNVNRKTKLVTERLDRKIEANELHFSSTRGGSVPGTHSVYFDSTFDTIELTHTARSRDGFAFGAVLGAERIQDKTGYFEIQDFMKDILK